MQGYISPQLKEQVLELTGVKENFFNACFGCIQAFTSSKKYTKSLCVPENAVEKKNSGEILSYLKKTLKVDKQGVSEDGRFKLRTRNCLKQCRTSPNLMIDGDLYSKIEIENIKKILNDL